jgi:hypothetical protein
MVVHVEDKILSHNGEADQADVTGCFWHKTSEFLLILLGENSANSKLQFILCQWPDSGKG